MSTWKKLSAINVSNHIEKKGQLSYLSWVWAWGTLMEHYPDSTYEFSPQCGWKIRQSKYK